MISWIVLNFLEVNKLNHEVTRSNANISLNANKFLENANAPEMTDEKCQMRNDYVFEIQRRILHPTLAIYTFAKSMKPF